MGHISYTAEQLLSGQSDNEVVAKEISHGNGGLIEALKISGIAGPFQVVDPWHLRDEQGETKINAGGYSALPFGERYPALIDFVARYLRDGNDVGLPQQASCQWRAELECRLVAQLALADSDHKDSQVFFSNSGAEAIESAIKFAKAFRPKAHYFINFSQAYHGKTMGALSLTPNKTYQKEFKTLPLDVATLPFGDIEAFEDKVRSLGAKNIVSVILEPIQGEAGVVVPPQDFLKQVDIICKKHGILVIADEIQTGLGRSGYWFASIEWGGMHPDIITLAKPLGGGLTAIGATIVRKRIFKKMLGGMDSKLQSNTFGGNSLAMAIGLKSLDIIKEENLVERARIMGERGHKRLQAMAQKYPDLFQDVSGFGMLFSANFQPISPTKTLYGPKAMVSEFTGLLGLMMWHRAGVLANFSLNSAQKVRLTPALTMPDDVFDQMFDKLEDCAEIYQSSWSLLLKTPAKTTLSLSKFALF